MSYLDYENILVGSDGVEPPGLSYLIYSQTRYPYGLTSLIIESEIDFNYLRLVLLMV